MGNPIFETEKIKTKKTYAEAAQPYPLNEHPIRTLLRQATESRVDDVVDDLEEMIIRQLRPRNISLLFGNETDSESLLSMDTVMTRLRRQLRQTSLRINPAQSPPDSRDRLEMDRMMRRIRQERRTTDSSNHRWEDEQRIRRRTEQERLLSMISRRPSHGER